MRPKKHKTTGSNDLFRARLDQIINLKHELVLLAGKIDWDWIDGEIAPLYSENGRPGIETRFMIGLLLLKHIYGLSDEGVCERWVHDPYFQFFTGEEFFQHAFPHERSDLSHWRKRLGDKLELLLAESLRVAHGAGALRGQDLKRCSRRPSPFRPMPSCCMRRSRGSTVWQEGTASGCGNPIVAWLRPRP
jgi:IS5 family transposase